MAKPPTKQSISNNNLESTFEKTQMDCEPCLAARLAMTEGRWITTPLNPLAMTGKS
ncbi:hypothetical protein [Helicobacter canis]|uniref:hypothetical protein n=1 Tax=Helicobacter canis TaxID=29419 RepID=UPI002942E560|nr:hypothetical protein [Helicobacter canis]